MNVSRLWSQFITSYPRLWSHLLVNTDDEDVLEYLQLFLQSSYNMQLLIVLHGSAAVGGGIMAELLSGRGGGGSGMLIFDEPAHPPTAFRSIYLAVFTSRNCSTLATCVKRWRLLTPTDGRRIWTKRWQTSSRTTSMNWCRACPACALCPWHHKVKNGVFEKNKGWLAARGNHQCPTARLFHPLCASNPYTPPLP